MAYRRYAHSAADTITDRTGRPLAGVSGTVWDAFTGGNRILDLLDEDGNAVNVVTSDGQGAFPFQAQDTNPSDLWVKWPRIDHRVLAQAADLGVRVDIIEDSGVSDVTPADGSITNAKVATNAAIAQSKISGLVAALAAKADTAGVVALTGAQTVAGVKTFSSPPVVPTAEAAGNPVTLAQLNAVSDQFVLGGRRIYAQPITSDPRDTGAPNGSIWFRTII